MCIKFVREKHDLSRFWELFIPTTNSFSFWLASAAFAFFAFSSLLPNKEANMSFLHIAREITAYLFLGVGWLFVAILVYLFLSWFFHFALRRKTKEDNEQPKQ